MVLLTPKQLEREEIEQWFSRHQYDDDPPKVLMTYLGHLLNEVDRLEQELERAKAAAAPRDGAD